MKNRYLVLMRHAKSSWEDESISDFDRPLNDRGRRSVPLIRSWFESQSIIPDCLLCSTAKRVQQTAELVRGDWPLPYLKIDLPELYLASPETILHAIQQHGPSEATTLLVVGHNPGFEILASMLSGQAIEFPTAAVAVFRVPQKLGWSLDLSGRQVRMEHHIVPRALQSSSDFD
jgi:phosphohistidine phosphatase